MQSAHPLPVRSWLKLESWVSSITNLISCSLQHQPLTSCNWVDTQSNESRKTAECGLLASRSCQSFFPATTIMAFSPSHTRWAAWTQNGFHIPQSQPLDPARAFLPSRVKCKIRRTEFFHRREQDQRQLNDIFATAIPQTRIRPRGAPVSKRFLSIRGIN